MNKERAAGCLVGLAVGDCLGAALEFSPKNRGAQVRDILPWRFGAAGSPTDDTDQAILLAETIKNGWAPHLFLGKLIEWAKSAPDVGNHTLKVMRSADTRTPFKASEQAWIASGRSAAPNGSLMRTAPVGVYVDNQDRCAKIAEEAGKVTHWDPRGVSACQLVSEIIRQKVWEQPLKVEAQNEEVIATVRSAMKQEERAYDGHDNGFVLHALHIAMRAFFGKQNFEETLIWVVNEGGDADTNGAIAGALLGARDGLKAIPERWRSACASTPRMLELVDWA
jgi:ADP-ribosylglycohydrolase